MRAAMGVLSGKIMPIRGPMPSTLDRKQPTLSPDPLSHQRDNDHRIGRLRRSSRCVRRLLAGA